MVEVELKPGVSGCIMVPLGCLSLGIVPLLTRLTERHFARRMDEQGVETRGGKRIAWSEFTKIKRVQSRMGRGGRGAVARSTVANELISPLGGLSDEYLLESPKGKVSVPLWRVKNLDEVRTYTLAHVPHLLTSEG